MRRRRGGEVISQGVLIVVGISAEGLREVLGVWVADSESEASWGEVFSELSRRGLRGVHYLVSDDHQGMRKSNRPALSRRCLAALSGALRAQRFEPHGSP
jgi:putative transposase